jgi:cytochrome c oxidase subunit 4
MSNTPHSDNETLMYENNQELLYHGESHGTKEIWMIFGWLTVITVLDIILYFAMPPTMFRNIIFIVFGIVKAYLIVGSFMHMKHERLNLALSIIVPVLFIIGLIMGLLYEGNFWSII